MSLFKSFQIGRVRPEIRIEAANVFNHPNWGTPVTTLHREQLPAVHRPRSGSVRVGRPTRPAALIQSACDWSSRPVVIVHALPAQAGGA